MTHREAARQLLSSVEGPIPMWIGGAFRANEDGFEASDPFLDERYAEFSRARIEDLDDAVRAAQEVQPRWAALAPRDRARALMRAAQVLREHKGELIQAEAIDAGVPCTLSARFSVAAMARAFEYYAEWCDKLGSSVIASGSTDAFDYTLREPAGVVAALTAWNTPSLFLGSKLAPALAAGNAVVVKPSERASLPAYLFARALAAAGLPEGLVNVVYGDGEVGRALVSHDGVDLVTFTGGSATGAAVAAGAGVRPTCLELGGKSAALVFADADIDRAAFQLCFGAFGLSGQACAAASRILVEESVFDAFVDKLAAMASSMALGDPLDRSTLLGPLIDEAHLSQVLDAIGGAGAKIICGGERRRDGVLAHGHFLPPTLLTDVSPEAEIAQREIFGPVSCVFRFRDEEEAVVLERATRYGLAGAVWTRSLSRAHRVAARMRAGFVWVNAYGTIPHTAPFGGFGASGHGKEGGREALVGFTRQKNVYVQL